MGEARSSFHNNCRTVIGFVDDQMYPPEAVVREHPLMSTVICVIASRAIIQEMYEAFLEEADDLVKKTFQGPVPDLLAVKAMMLLAVWSGRPRLWGYIASLAAELKLNTAALQLGDDAVEHTEEIVDQARTWLTLCCFDLVYVATT
jgi:hypothetical protein